MGEARHSNLERDMCDTYCIRCIMKRIVESGVAASASGVTSYASGVTTFASSVTAFASGVTAFAGRPTFRQIHFGPNGFRPMLFSSYPGFVQSTFVQDLYSSILFSSNFSPFPFFVIKKQKLQILRISVDTLFRFVARFARVRIEDSSLNRCALNGIQRDFFGGDFFRGDFDVS